MGKYILKRLGMMVLTLFIMLTLCFFALRLMPGSPYDSMLDNPEMPPEMLEAMKAKIHLDKPMLVQYVYFLRGVVFEGNWGTSIVLRPGVDAFTIMKERIPASMLLNVLSLFVCIPLGILAGTVCGMFKNRLPDYLISFMVVIFISVPSFVFASLMQYFLASKAGWFPIIYNVSGTPTAQLRSLVLPVLALSFGSIATLCRYLRGELIETLSSEYMLLARTKGLKRSQAVVRHAFRNSMVPLANIIIPMFTNILGGSMVVESIFAVPGIGGMMVDSITANDYFLTIAALMFYSVISLTTTLIVDISYGIIDPRIRLGAKK
ncbi:MAG: ABC transporter permease [Ruminococcaceae bacterium]|nr:ABC transporter permease [Oscillospiraceae bacterium]